MQLKKNKEQADYTHTFSWGDITNANREAMMRQECRAQPGQPRQGVRSSLFAIIPQDEIEDSLLGARAQRGLIHIATHDLTVVDHHEGVIGAEILILGVVLPFSPQIDLDINIL